MTMASIPIRQGGRLRWENEEALHAYTKNVDTVHAYGLGIARLPTTKMTEALVIKYQIRSIYN